jgi:hypothetical protein
VTVSLPSSSEPASKCRVRRRTIRDSAVVGGLEVAVSGEGVADARVLGLDHLLVDGVVEALRAD